MIKFGEILQKIVEFFLSADPFIKGNWAKWYHYGIPDYPEEVRKKVIDEYALYGHCKECTSMSGCFFINGENTFPHHPHHQHCHCEKNYESPHEVTAYCDINKFTKYEFVNPAKKPYMDKLGFDISQSEYLKNEFEKQAKEKYISGDYKLRKQNEYGQRIDILIEVKNKFGETKNLISGWMVRPRGRITCNTPIGDK